MWSPIPLAAIILFLGAILHRLFFHSLSRVPGPFLARFSSLYLHTICYLGIEATVLRHQHNKYKTKVLRVAPNSVSISDSEAIAEIYVKGGGFPKDDRYKNFNLGPIVSIFSSLDREYRDVRAKAVAPLFSPAQLRAESGPEGVIGGCIAEFVDQLRKSKEAGIGADLMDMCARLSIDVVTGYLLGQRYGGLQENAHLPLKERQSLKLSANSFIFAIVAFSRFSLLPHRIFQFLYAASQRLSTNDEVTESFAKLDRFTNRVLESTTTGEKASEKPNGGFYHERLLSQAKISQMEAAAQSQAVVFAGADSTAVMLATILFHLVQNGAARSRLLCEVRADKPQDMRFLRAVVKEGLRLGMANPTRMTRIVPSSGLRVGDTLLPPGTIVGCAAYNLHHDPDVFPEPFSFRPERWLDDGTDRGLRRPGMEKSMIPFGVGSRACIGKNLAQQQLHDTVVAIIDSEVLEGSRTCQERIEIIEWFNADIKGHRLNIKWS
ncbi:cytochrome P450 [Annulohypoxylon maeteangense]|uniref:cytochrome P450 n=1 Tax=Annulohypoxylon maeteangense TaxID=1927788 RepID=UPI0020076619|nr:cytochrome P450 [Annulohypoxylon maeteangense]KAI0884088.1 cytochrome P450 [Annulohypoxylon maeteangense]